LSGCLRNEALALALLVLSACSTPASHSIKTVPDEITSPWIIVLGTAQDGGYPQAGCARPGCDPAWRDPGVRRFVASLGLVDPASGQRWIFDATPDFRDQLRLLDSAYPVDAPLPGLSGIFLTHAHIGHYTGLMMLGREVLGASRVPVHALPRMSEFLRTNGPWDQLIRLENILLQPLEEGRRVELTDTISVTPLIVPHRDEYSETAGFIISGPEKSILFLPDIDKWDRWDTDIEDIVRQVDIAYIDGTFYENGEVPGRDMSSIPHPFIEETMDRLGEMPADERSKIRFIHLNHSNPALLPDSEAQRRIRARGFNLAGQGERIGL
jgi:pyrroloquinoline quinone biosynthesis protein B